MGLFTAVRAATGTATEQTDDQPPTVRCRNCGQYYTDDDALCPHCNSGNKIRGGLPDGQTRR